MYFSHMTFPAATQEDSQFFRLLLLLQAIDTKLLRDSVEHLSQDTRLNMQAAEAEVELLKSVAGIEDHNCLLSIDWESSYTFRCEIGEERGDGVISQWKLSTPDN